MGDMEQTKEAIVCAAECPVSIIIVGVGEANFDAMDELDGDEVRISTQKGKIATRDIVQFVPLRNFYKASHTGNQDFTSASTKSYLAAEVLAEIQGQLISYMKSRHIAPLNVTQSPILSTFNSSDMPNGNAANVISNEIYSSDDE